MSEQSNNMQTDEATKVVESSSASSTKEVSQKSIVPYVLAVVIVVGILLGVLYSLEKEGRSSTNIFAGLIESQRSGQVVAEVNGAEITQADLDVSMQQFAQAAAAQGVDLSNPAAVSEMQAQALEVLINTELLLQQASESGVSISDEAVDARLDEIVESIGGEEVLEERVAELGIDRDTLRENIREELVIQSYLDQLFSEAEVEVTDEEIESFYSSIGGGEGVEGLPSLDEVRDQIEAQIVATKEQEVIDSTLSELRAEAEIEVAE